MPEQRFLRALWGELQNSPLGSQLKSAADGARLNPWTQLLTEVTVRACQAAGWAAAARNVTQPVLPIKRSEYLAVDVMAFSTGSGWRRPVAAIELENSPRVPLIAYAVWKVSSVLCQFACVICYRKRWGDVPDLVEQISDEVLAQMQPSHPFLMIVGTRGRAATFPDAYFTPFRWDSQRGRLISAALR